MRVKYNLKENHFKSYNEASGVALMKNKLLKKPSKKIRSYLGKTFSYGILLMGLCITFVILARVAQNNTFIKFFELLLLYVIFIFIFSILSIFFSFLSAKKNNSVEGSLSITKKGITSTTSLGDKLELSYDSVELVAVTKHAVVFILKTPFMLYIDNKNKDKVVKALQKYSDTLIINGENGTYNLKVDNSKGV